MTRLPFTARFVMFRSRLARWMALPADPTVAITTVMYRGTIVLTGLFALIFAASVFAAGNYYALPRIYGVGVLIAYAGVLRAVYRRQRFRTAAWLLIVFYALIGITTLALWSINAPTGLLLLGFVVLLAGVMLGARYIVPVTGGLIVLLFVLQRLDAGGITNPETALLAYPSTLIDASTYATVFIVFGLVSWLSGRRMEQALARALQAEADLQHEKDNLSVRLEQKTREVREAQLDEMRQLYRFAELGQLGTVLLHDLANNLSALTLDIDDIERRNKRSQSVKRAKESIAYLENMIGQVRAQLRENDRPVTFDGLLTILETVTALGPKARRAGVTIEYKQTDRPFMLTGDPLRFAQILTILISNAIESYGERSPGDSRPVVIDTRIHAKRLHITVTDYGSGIAAAARRQVFKPFVSTKPNGMGIGLFMAHEMVTRHFKGTLTLDPDPTRTCFVVAVPRSKTK